MHRILIVFSIFLISNVVLGHGDEDHRDPRASQQVKLDDDGFEIISSGPSKEVLAQINQIYKKEVKGIFSNKCLTCHGVNNSMPWYYSIPGAKHLMDKDMREAKEHMDMSNDFPFGGHGSPIDDLDALKKTVENHLHQLDLVTREEFDVQKQVLLKTREKIEALEKKLNN